MWRNSGAVAQPLFRRATTLPDCCVVLDWQGQWQNQRMVNCEKMAGWIRDTGVVATYVGERAILFFFGRQNTLRRDSTFNVSQTICLLASPPNA